MSSTSCSGVTPSAAATEIASNEFSRSSRRCAVGIVKTAKVAVPSELDAAVLRDAGDPEVLHGLQRRDLDRIAETVALLVRGPRVDHDLVGRGRPRSLDQPERIELRLLGVDAEAERRRALRVDRLAVGLEDLRRRLVGDAARRGLDAVERPDVVEQALGHRRRLRGRPLERDVGRLAADRRVGVGIRLAEDRVERLVDRVREDEGSAHHRDAEHDGERGQRRAELPPREPPERDPDHVSVTSRIVLRISSSPAPPRSLTISPSARKRMRSAEAAARASCVTITIVWP